MFNVNHSCFYIAGLKCSRFTDRGLRVDGVFWADCRDILGEMCGSYSPVPRATTILAARLALGTFGTQLRLLTIASSGWFELFVFHPQGFEKTSCRV